MEMMFTDSSCSMKYNHRQCRNKWINQQIHKRRNKIQRASKRYIYVNQQVYEDNDIIFKKKYPLKQRKDRKKFKTQRRRKKLYKRMAFDFNDFMFQNKNENYRRIQIRPTISYYNNTNNNNDIQSIYDDYYYPSTDHDAHDNMKQHYDQSDIDGVIVNIQSFRFKVLQISNHQNNNYGWNWRHHIPRSRIQEDNDLRTAIAASLDDAYQSSSSSSSSFEKNECIYSKLKPFKYATTYPSVYGSKACHYPQYIKHQKIRDKLSFTEMARRLWSSYKNVLKIEHEPGRWNYLWEIKNYTETTHEIDLECVLNICIPDLWPMYHIIFQFMGYESLNVLTIKAKLKISSDSDSFTWSGSNANHGITYHDSKSYIRSRRYSDYTKDIKSYIPSYLYYKTKPEQENTFTDIGEYNQSDWDIIACFNRKKKKNRRTRTDKNNRCRSQVSGYNRYMIGGYLRCPCGCGRRVRTRSNFRRILKRKLISDDRAGSGESSEWGYSRKLTGRVEGVWQRYFCHQSYCRWFRGNM